MIETKVKIPSIPGAVLERFDRAMDAVPVSQQHRTHWRRWLDRYFDFCNQYSFDALSENTVPLFISKLRDKNAQPWQCDQAEKAVRLYCEKKYFAKKES
jgi:hypothetical protein